MQKGGHFVCTHRLFAHTYLLVPRTQAATLSINPRGAGQRFPLDGDSRVHLHLARTHQQGHKVNKCQPLNLVLPDRCKGPQKKREFIFLTRLRDTALLLFVQVGLQPRLTYVVLPMMKDMRESKSRQLSPVSSTGKLNLEKIRAQLDLLKEESPVVPGSLPPLHNARSTVPLKSIRRWHHLHIQNTCGMKEWHKREETETNLLD